MEPLALTATVAVVLLAAAAYAAGRSAGRARVASQPEAPAHDAPAAGALEERVGAMAEELRRMTALVQGLERGRAEAYGVLSEQVRASAEQTARLTETTGQLRAALANSKARGQWGERMAEDVLRLAGFVENLNYRKQRAIDGGGIPDFTFLLPDGLELHMDVKFPLDNYLRHRDAEHDAEREAARVQFLRDVRGCVKALAERGYADPATGVDCTLLFVPNEQLFAFIQEQDPGLLDEALGRKVVLCSPLTLFAVLAVVRQAVDQFRLQRTSDEILTLLSRFRGEWSKFTGELDKLGRQLETVRRTYDEVTGPRRRQLERPLETLDNLRRERGVAAGDYPPSPSAPLPPASLVE